MSIVVKRQTMSIIRTTWRLTLKAGLTAGAIQEALAQIPINAKIVRTPLDVFDDEDELELKDDDVYEFEEETEFVPPPPS